MIWEYLKLRMSEYASEVAFPAGNVTYRALIKRVEREAARIRGKGRIVPVHSADPQTMAVQLLAVLASGNAALPLEERYASAQTAGVRPGECSACPEGLELLLYTSGTGGVPKGVMLSGRSVTANLDAVGTFMRGVERKRMLIARPLVHSSVLIGELFLGLCRGFSIVFFCEDFQPIRIRRQLERAAIQYFGATPTMLYHVAWCGGRAPEALELCVVSGERLNPRAVQTFAEHLPGVAMYHGYGLTEHSPRVCMLGPEDFYARPGSVGKPLPGVQVRLDNGELAVRSECVMMGYYRDADRTSQKLRDGWLYTGDAARCGADGYYEILGRKDDMIIRCGVNIYPQEIEEVLCRCPGVDACLAYGEDDLLYGQKILAKYTGEASESAVRAYLQERLPAYMVPCRLDRVQSLEMTASGKAVRRG